MDAPDPLTGHSYRLHTLHDLIGTRGLTFVRNVLLPSTHSSASLSSSVSNLMRRRPIPLLPLAQGARRSPHIYPANRIRSDGRPRRIRCYEMCSIDSGLWCWDTTTQAASDDAPSQRRGWRGVLSFSFEVRVRQGRVTFPCKSLQGVRAPNSVADGESLEAVRTVTRAEEDFKERKDLRGGGPSSGARGEKAHSLIRS